MLIPFPWIREKDSRAKTSNSFKRSKTNKQTNKKVQNRKYKKARCPLFQQEIFIQHLWVLLLLFCCSVVFNSANPWTAARQAPLSLTISRSLFKLMFIKLWCHPTMSSSDVPFFSRLQSFPGSGSFPIRWPFASGGQSIGASALASVLPMNIQDWFPLELTDLISLQSNRLSGVFSNTTVQKHQLFETQPSLWSNSHIHTWPLEKP